MKRKRWKVKTHYCSRYDEVPYYGKTLRRCVKCSAITVHGEQFIAPHESEAP